MTMLEKLLDQLKIRGLSVAYRDEETLTLSGPEKERTPEVMKTLKAFKPDLIKHLRPRDLTKPRYDVHHQPPPEVGPLGEFECVQCKSTVWDREETAVLCDQKRCPIKGGHP